MNNPDGYTALDLVGYTDQGDYDAIKSYVANDLVHYGGSIWCCLIDDTTGITPTEGVNWRFWVEDSQNGISDIVNVLGAKNLIPYPYYDGDSVTRNGITFTVNADKSITAVGTATSSAAYTIALSETITQSGVQYKLNGCPSNGSSSTYRIETYESNATPATVAADFGSTTDGVAFVGEGHQRAIRIVIYPAAGEVSLTFYPMIRPSGIEDATYVPYTKTNKELTEEVTQNSSDIQTLSNNVGANTNDIADLQSAISGGTSNWEHIFGVIRKTSDGWVAYEDSIHESSHIASVVSNGASGLDIMFDKTYAKVGVGIVVPDETYSRYGYVCGASVTVDRATINMYNSRPYKGGIQYNSNGVNLLSDYGGDLESVTWDSTNQKVVITPKNYANTNKHRFIAVTMGSNNLPNGNFIPKVSFLGTGEIEIYPQVDLTNYSGWFIVSFETEPTINVDAIPVSTDSNLWFDCWMKKATN